ncbi:hypothetical protein M5K25_000021 [Dendrobium thyrsiflorum]|uniref:Uncharacterized protein n=1 Tax=Dendrobium thyrsiflorum TaxID=117978 RepID=A0ABD0VSU7_DENTH
MSGIDWADRWMASRWQGTSSQMSVGQKPVSPGSGSLWVEHKAEGTTGASSPLVPASPGSGSQIWTDTFPPMGRVQIIRLMRMRVTPPRIDLLSSSLVRSSEQTGETRKATGLLIGSTVLLHWIALSPPLSVLLSNICYLEEKPSLLFVNTICSPAFTENALGTKAKEPSFPPKRTSKARALVVSKALMAVEAKPIPTCLKALLADMERAIRALGRMDGFELEMKMEGTVIVAEDMVECEGEGEGKNKLWEMEDFVFVMNEMGIPTYV